MKKITILMFVFLTSFIGLSAQTNCLDWNEYVNFKNTSGTGYYSLTGGVEEKAAQTYHYSGPGNITDIRLEGKVPLGAGSSYWSYLKVSIYNVDASNRPTTIISSKYIWWNLFQTQETVHFGGGGVAVNNNFAVAVELFSWYSGQIFQVKYTGDGEGNTEDLPSLAGTSTGGNWISMMPAKDGDLYIKPRMNHFITADFSPSATCNLAVSQPVNFTNLTQMTTDKMFNTISIPGYTGSKTLYSWDFGDGSPLSTQQTPSHSYSTGGVYTVSLTSTIDSWPMGGSFCSDTKTMKVSVGLNVTATTTNLTCNNDNTGVIVLSASGGDNSIYMYSLNSSTWQSSPTFSNLSAGSYTFAVKDGMGCIEYGAAPVIITEPSPIVIASPTGITAATCGNSDGAILASASGGTGTLMYSLNASPYQVSGSFPNLAGGTHTLSVRDANGCIETNLIVLPNFVGPTLALQSYTNVSCNNGSDGTITLIGSGGSGALQYTIDGINFQSSGVFTNISAGFYAPYVKDVAGCIGALPCIMLPGPCGITINEPTAITFDLTQTAALCNGSNTGQIDVLNPIGGIGTLTFSVNGINFQSGTNFSGLLAGTYTVTVRDAAGCFSTNTITVAQPNAIIATVIGINNLSCNTSGDGEFLVTATGGNGIYTYSLNGIDFFPAGAFNSMSAGTYSITVKDGNGCLGTSSVTLTQPAAITASFTTGNSTCGNSNGTILAVAGGGSGTGYTYSIDGGSTNNTSGSFAGLAAGTYLVLVTDGSGCQHVFTVNVTDSNGPTITGSTFTNVTCNGGNDGTVTITGVSGGTGTIQYSSGGIFQTSNLLSGLSAGNHTIIVKDANGCTGEITVTLTEPNPFTILLTGTNVSCSGGNSGSISVNAAGGAGTLAYSLDGVNFQSTSVFNNLTADTYYVVVRDAGGCTGENVITITQPTAISVFVGSLNVSCNGGSDGAISVIASGGNGTLQNSIDGINYQVSGSFTGLTAQLYSIYTKDANGCISITNINISQPTNLALSSVVSHVSCAGGDNGVINITVNGGKAPYTYSWSTLSFNEDIFNLIAGTYTVTVTDANGCSINGSFTVSEPTNPIIVNGVVTATSGATVADGVVDITVSGGTAPYTYNWNNGAVSEDISSLLPGVYVVIVTDANGCTTTTSYTVSFNVGIDKSIIENGLNIYPNPAKDEINIELDANNLAERIVLINMIGSVIYDATPISSRFNIDVKSYPNGIYFINIYVGKDVITKKVVINR
jgi:hypothetical protein